MNLFFRLFKVLLLYLLRPGRIGVADSATVTFRVWPNDLDTNGHMNNGRYLTLMDLGRLDLLMRMGGLAPTLRRRWLPALTGMQIRFRRSLRLFQVLTIRTRLLSWDGRWVFLEQSLHRGDEMVALAYLKAAFIGPRGTVPMAEVLRVSGIAAEPPPLPEAVAAWQAAEESMAAAFKASGSRPVR